MKKCILFILLLQICAIGRAQSTSKTIEKINNNYYIVEGNETYKVDQKLLLVCTGGQERCALLLQCLINLKIK